MAPHADQCAGEGLAVEGADSADSVARAGELWHSLVMGSIASQECRRLAKGANVKLRDLDAELGVVTVVLETGDTVTAEAIDADVSVFLLGHDRRVRSNDDFVFYNQPISPDGAVHLRDKIRREATSAAVVTLNLDAVPDDVERVLLVASLDATIGPGFADATALRLTVQRSDDGSALVTFDIVDATTERALLFGEFYRREGMWRFRAIGQGYAGGLDVAAAEYGIEVADEAADAEQGEAVRGTSDAAPEVDRIVASDNEDRVSVRRRVRPPRMPDDWNRTLPSSKGGDLIPARLFPIAGIGGGDEQEGRATSALLAVMALVRPFGRALLTPLGAPAGNLEAFTEVPFALDEKPYRPDGYLRVTRGQRTWTCLVEVKTAGNPLDAQQIQTYVEIARRKGIDAVLTITNQVCGIDGRHPVDIDGRKLRKVALHHLSWDEISTAAVLLADHRPIPDATQATVLEEFLRYMRSSRSGLHGFTDMGPAWTQVRDGARRQTLNPSDREVADVCAQFEQLMRHIALRLTGLLGVEVKSAIPAEAPDHLSQVEQLASAGVLFGCVKVPGTVGPLIVRVDLRAERVTVSIRLPAPREGRPATRVKWLVRQLGDARPDTRIDAYTATSRTATSRVLSVVREDPNSLIDDPTRELRSFQVSFDLPTGSKRGAGRGSLIDSVQSAVDDFYVMVVQNLRAWVGKPPKMESPGGRLAAIEAAELTG